MWKKKFSILKTEIILTYTYSMEECEHKSLLVTKPTFKHVKKCASCCPVCSQPSSFFFTMNNHMLLGRLY